jgi:hypothetical protein
MGLGLLDGVETDVGARLTEPSLEVFDLGESVSDVGYEIRSIEYGLDTAIES